MIVVSIAFAIQAAAPVIMTTAAPMNRCNHPVAVTQPAAPKGPLPPGRTAFADVQVAASGTVNSVKIATSSGNATFDRVTMDLARRSTYSPEVKNCKPIAAVYKFMLSSRGRP